MYVVFSSLSQIEIERNSPLSHPSPHSSDWRCVCARCVWFLFHIKIHNSCSSHHCLTSVNTRLLCFAFVTFSCSIYKYKRARQLTELASQRQSPVEGEEEIESTTRKKNNVAMSQRREGAKLYNLHKSCRRSLLEREGGNTNSKSTRC